LAVGIFPEEKEMLEGKRSIEKMGSIKFFDSNCSIGRRSIVNPHSFYDTAELLIAMKYYGIGRAMVYHSLGREYNPVEGNRMLMDEINDCNILYPIWCIMPHHTGEFPAPTELAEQLRTSGIKAVTLFPSERDQRFSLEPWSCGEMFSMLEEYRIIVMLGIDQTTWAEVYRLLKDFSELRLLLKGVGYDNNRILYPLMEKFPNLYIETSGVNAHLGIEDICKRFGAGRMVFGSGMPEFSGGAAVTLIYYAQISDEDKNAISNVNLDSLLRGVRL
jgi:Predicted metal-dependent hydrolase of the TIM-barrel fold